MSAVAFCHAGGLTTDLGPSRFGRIRAGMRAVFGRAIDVALPKLCAACREPVGGEGLCAGCWSKLSFIARPYCERLGIPFPTIRAGHSVHGGDLRSSILPACARGRCVTTRVPQTRPRLNTATGSTSPPPWAGGWRMPAVN